MSTDYTMVSTTIKKQDKNYTQSYKQKLTTTAKKEKRTRKPGTTTVTETCQNKEWDSNNISNGNMSKGKKEWDSNNISNGNMSKGKKE